MFDKRLTERISRMFLHSRQVSGKSQAAVAKELGVSKNTVQNWEYGNSFPSILTVFKWFDAVDVPILPYVNYVCHSRIQELSPGVSIKEKRDRLKNLIDEYPEHMLDELLFMFDGEHGASVAGALDGFTAYLHLPLKTRVSIMQNIGTNYLLCKADNSLSNTHKVMPDTDVLHEYVRAGLMASLQGKNTYV